MHLTSVTYKYAHRHAHPIFHVHRLGMVQKPGFQLPKVL